MTYGAGGPNQSFAFLTDHYMRTFGATREDFGQALAGVVVVAPALVGAENRQVGRDLVARRIVQLGEPVAQAVRHVATPQM